MPWTNYHSHSHFCDGKEAPDVHILAAINKNFLAFGCSSHAHVPFEASWCMKAADKEKYKQVVLGLKEKYKEQIQVYLSLEVDYIPGMIGPNAAQKEMELDYTVGSVHFVDHFEDKLPWGIDGTRQEFERGLAEIFEGNIKGAISRYYELTRQMLKEDCPDILGHMDKVKMHNTHGNYFNETDSWYRKQVLATLEVAKASGVIIELNSRGMYKKKTLDPYPSPWILQKILEMQIPLTLNSDSHHPDDIDKLFEESAKLLIEIGFKELHILLDGEWQPRSFSAGGFLS